MMNRALFAVATLLAALSCGVCAQTSKQPKVAPGPGEPNWEVILRERFGLSLFGDLLNPVAKSAQSTPGLFRKAGAARVKFTPIIALGLPDRTRGGWYTDPRSPSGAPQKSRLWTYTFKNTADDLRTGKNLPPPLEAGSTTEFDPGDTTFGLWISNDQFGDGGVFSQPGLVARFNHRLAAQPYKAMIYPDRDKASGKNVPHSYLIGWEYSTNDDFQDVVCRIENVDLVAAQPDGQQTKSTVSHVVFVTGDEEYRSEESMPMLAKILHRDYGFNVTVCYALSQEGIINPNNLENVAGLEAVDSADLLVMFTRFRKLPDAQLEHIVRYAQSGKPVAGFRTATHAFRYDRGPRAAMMNEAWPIRVFGQKWITHHGHFGDGHELLTEVSLNPEFKDHPILRGVVPFRAYSWLYHVEGGGDRLNGNCQRLLVGKALKTSHEKELKRFPVQSPVAWTKIAPKNSGEPQRVFFTTLGHPYDFTQEPMRKLAINGLLWALGMEEKIPSDGAKAESVGPYEPNNSGFGDKFKPDRRPEALGESRAP
jgi:type 1 glutamine amidotransferase